MRRLVRCYAQGHADGTWEALCLDFDLAVQGRSFEEVYESLNTAVRDYVAFVHTLPAEEQPRLLARQAPLKDRAIFAVRMLRAALSGESHSRAMPYTLPCTA